MRKRWCVSRCLHNSGLVVALPGGRNSVCNTRQGDRDRVKAPSPTAPGLRRPVNRKIPLFVLCACLFAHADADPSFANLPLRFESSRDPSAKFLARGNGYTLYLTGSGAILRTRSAAIRMKMAG